MTDATRLKLSYFFTLLAIAMLVGSMLGMMQSPRPEWTRSVLFAALFFVFIGRMLRHGVRRRT